MKKLDFTFGSEEDAVIKASNNIYEIFNNQTYINPEKFSNFLDQQRKKQWDCSNEMNALMNNQIEGLLNATEILDNCQQSCVSIDTYYKELDQLWLQDTDFHLDMEIFIKILRMRKNLGECLDQMKSFMNVGDQLKKMEKMLENDEFEFVGARLLELTKLKEKIVGVEGIEQIEQFEQKFQRLMFGIIENTLRFAKEKPQQLISVLKVFENNDKYLETEQKPPFYCPKCQELITNSINTKFSKSFENANTLADILQKQDFVLKDLNIVLDYVVKLFPKKYEILNIYQTNYKLVLNQLLFSNKKKY